MAVRWTVDVRVDITVVVRFDVRTCVCVGPGAEMAVVIVRVSRWVGAAREIVVVMNCVTVGGV